MQEIYISLDDSGKLTIKEIYSVFAGIVFLSNQERNRFMGIYEKHIYKIRCGYCYKNSNHCDGKCIELKSNQIKKKHHRRMLMSVISNYHTFAVVIKNRHVYKDRITDKHKKGKFLDFVQKMIVKDVINQLINQKKINPHKPIHLFLFFDEQPTKTDGKYNLESSIYEELINGMNNPDQQIFFKPILFSELKITLKYRDSKYNTDVQAADMVAGTVRRILLNDDSWSNKVKSIQGFINTFDCFPR